MIHWNEGEATFPVEKGKEISPHSPQNMTKLRKTAQKTKESRDQFPRLMIGWKRTSHTRLRESYWMRALEIMSARPAYAFPIGCERSKSQPQGRSRLPLVKETS